MPDQKTRETVYSVQYYKKLPNGDREAHSGGTVETDFETQKSKVKSHIEDKPYLGATILEEERDEHGNIYPPGNAGNPFVVDEYTPDKIIGVDELDGVTGVTEVTSNLRKMLMDFIEDNTTIKSVESLRFNDVKNGREPCEMQVVNATTAVNVASTIDDVDILFSINRSSFNDQSGQNYNLREVEIVVEDYDRISP